MRAHTHTNTRARAAHTGLTRSEPAVGVAVLGAAAILGGARRLHLAEHAERFAQPVERSLEVEAALLGTKATSAGALRDTLGPAV